MLGNRGRKKDGWLCLPPEAMRILGLICMAAGVLLIVLFVPIRYWMALLGVILAVVGFWLFRG